MMYLTLASARLRACAVRLVLAIYVRYGSNGLWGALVRLRARAIQEVLGAFSLSERFTSASEIETRKSSDQSSMF